MASVRELRSTVLIAGFAATGSLVPVGASLLAQGVTTAVILGTVRAGDATDVDGARVAVVNAATGFAVESEVRRGRFLVQGLEIGGPYSITIRRIGFLPEKRESLFLRLGEPLELAFVLQPVAVRLDTLRVVIPAPFPQAKAHGGTATTIPDSLLQRLPTLNRDFYDFVRLVPQISTKIGFRSGLSGGGVGFRFNNFLINGVRERTVFANATAALAGGKSVPLEAVKEYQVLLAPYDVRYGDFAGALVNTVTKSGSNDLNGSAFGYWRNDRLARGDLASPYERLQYGFSLGGPILRDRLHFFIAPELQHLTAPAPGPYSGQPASALPPVPVSAADLTRLEGILRGHGLVAGSAGAVKNGNPLLNGFARLDLAIPEWNSRAVVWSNYGRSSNTTFSRAARDTFSLSTYQATQRSESYLTSAQVHTALGRTGAHNELLVSHKVEQGRFLSDVQQPIVRVSVPSTSGGAVTVNTGTNEATQGMFIRGWAIQIQNNLTLPLGTAHLLTLGVAAERFRIDHGGVPGSYGTWTFSSLDSLEGGSADRFELRKDFGSASVPIAGWQYGASVGDHWRAGERITVTLGLRADWLSIGDHAPYNPVVDSIFGRRTDAMPPSRVHFSPRLGFAWDVSGTGSDQLRGGIGVFTGRPPIAWILSALSSHGVGIGVLRCGRLPLDAGLPPPFSPDHSAPPTTCTGGASLTSAPRGDVDLLDRRLGMAQTLRASLAYDRRLPWGLLATAEALITRNLSDFVFVNLNLAEPQAVDRYGRVLYGTIGPTGLAAPVLRSNFSEVIDLRKTSKNHSYQLSARLEKRFSRGVATLASYTYSRVRDVQTPLRTGVPGIVNWSSRAVSGRQDDLSAEISLNDVPHRMVLAGTYTAPWDRWSTVFSFFYVGESGSPFTYRAWGVGRRGDLNADGSNANDPIYVPRDVFDPDEVTFSGQSAVAGADNSPAAQAERVSRQQVAFDRLIERTPCLRRQRGHILERNSCREPWSHTTVVSLRQAIPIAGQALEAELDLFNALNLLKGDWGLYREAAPALLEHLGHTPGPPDASKPIFRFDATAPQWTILQTESAFQLQVALRYRF